MSTRILVDAHVFDSGFQGTRSFIKGLYTELLGYPDLEIYFAARDTDRLRLEFPQPAARFIRLQQSSAVKRLAFEFPAIIKKHRIDFAHFQYIVPPVKNCGFIVTIHDVIFKDYPEQFATWYRLQKRFLYKKSAAKADIITTVSSHSQRAIRQHLGTGTRPILLTPNGIAPQFFEPYDKNALQEKIRDVYGIGKFILYVSRIEPRKNQAMLVKAFQRSMLYQQGYHLVLAGKESIRTPAFHDALASLTAEQRAFVTWLPEVSDAQLVELYRAARFFVYPSAAEGFGIPPLEAAAARVPVLCSNAAALGDFHFFGSGHVAMTGEETLARQLLELITTPPSADALETISKKIEKDYSWKASAACLYVAICEQSSAIKLQLHDTVRTA